MLRGRAGELKAMDALLDAVRDGSGRALVVRGEAGIGKSALLDRLAARAADGRVLRAAGVEWEMELAYAGLHQLISPLMEHAPRLRRSEREALETAIGLGASDAPDPSFVGRAVLSLLAAAAREHPLVCIVDDAQWLDRASAQALSFAARRLTAARVALVLATREGDAGGLPQLVLAGLRDDDARALLDAVVPGPLDARVRERIVAEARGNPLALLELPRSLTAAELACGLGQPVALPGRIEESFVRRLDSLPDDTRRLLLLAAADALGDPELLRRAGERLGIAPSAAAPAEAAGLLAVGERVRFRHPLVRSAVYRVAPPAERRRVHAALAEVTDGARAVWHRAQAASGPDEEVALALEQCADEARARGGAAGAAALLQRAAMLTLVPELRARRTLEAARAMQQSGAPDCALELLAASRPLDELQQARADVVRGQIAFASERAAAAPPLLLAAARRLEPLDAALARDAYLDALAAAVFAGEGAHEVMLAARLAPSPESARAADLLLDALVALLADGHAAAAPALRRALRAVDGELPEGALNWLWLACRVAHVMYDDERSAAISKRMVQLARTSGALSMLPIAFGARIVQLVFSGELAEAAAQVADIEAVSAATHSRRPSYGALALAAWRGHEDEARAVYAAAIKDATARGEAFVLTYARSTLAVLYNGLGRYDDALAAARDATASWPDRGLASFGLSELVEAAVRAGDEAAAADALKRLVDMTSASGTNWAVGMRARCRALVSEGDEAEYLYREAIERLGRTRIRGELARAHLLYGEWLRRERRRVDAREQLRIAHEQLDAIGADAFAARAERELQATAATARKRGVGGVEFRDQLTAQEATVAALAREGLSNPEISARLFISPRTVEYHLYKAFGKLDIRSRDELRRVLPVT